ncbi:hypothetical protein Areg01_00790 [Actinoplanes regularis]|nr:hypothetical protein Areg01_00790 [Actinoplanes regularis]
MRDVILDRAARPRRVGAEHRQIGDGNHGVDAGPADHQKNHAHNVATKIPDSFRGSLAVSPPAHYPAVTTT